MKIIINNFKSKYFEISSTRDLEISKDSYLKLFSKKESLQAKIFFINESISTDQLLNLKKSINKINIYSLEIFSNNRESIIAGKSLKINSTFLIEKELKFKLNLLKSRQENDTFHKGTVRSGDRLSANGNLFIIGDVNPGAIVSAKNNIYVWGKLLGKAFAGEGGDINSSIASLYLKPLQLRIADVIAIGPKDKPKNYYPEIAVVEKQSIIIKPHLMDNQN